MAAKVRHKCGVTDSFSGVNLAETFVPHGVRADSSVSSAALAREKLKSKSLETFAGKELRLGIIENRRGKGSLPVLHSLIQWLELPK